MCIRDSVSTFSNLFRYNAENDTLFSMINTSFSDIEISFVTDIQEVDSSIWVGSRNGLMKIPYDLNKKPKIYKKEKSNSIVDNDIRDIEYSSLKDELWVSTKNGISIFDLGSKTFKNIQVTLYANSIVENDIKDLLLAEKSNRVWFTTSNLKGINNISFAKNSHDTVYVNLQHDEADETSIPGNSITSFLEDKAGNVWFGTANAGLSINSNFSSKFSLIKYDSDNDWGLLKSKIYAVEAAKDDFLWVATDYGLEYVSVDGIRYDNLSKTYLGTSQIIDIFYQNDESLWVGTTSGLLNVNTKNRSVKRYSSKSSDEKYRIDDNVVFDIYHDARDNLIWVSTRKGVSIISLDDFKIINYSMPHPIRFVFKDHNKHTWFITLANGAYKALASQASSIYDNQKIRFEHYKFDKNKKNGVSSSKITSYAQANSNTIWFGTTNGGLNKFDIQSNKFEHIFIKDGLPSNYITALKNSDSGNLWISSKNGISMLLSLIHISEPTRPY